jgi:ubiquinone/menaquinone biosynthesis C-methylase UbiE
MTETRSFEPSASRDPALHRIAGAVLHAPRFYDLMLGLLFMGRERRFRERLLSLASLRPGESVLDVGCGTGSLALLAREQVGPGSDVRGIDASAQMIARASAKARRSGVEVDFRQAPAQALPFPDAQFDVVLSTLMLHHLPPSARAQLVCEARRVLKPRGRVLVVDFTRSTRRSGFGLRRGHGKTDPDEIVALLTGAGLRLLASGPVGAKSLYFALAAFASEP